MPRPPTHDDALERFVRDGLTRAWTAAVQHATQWVANETGYGEAKSRALVDRAMSL
jgi:hypothetical protein